MTANTAGGTKEIVEGCQKGSIGFRELMYKSFYGYVMGVVLRYISSQDDAQELVNDSFIKIFKHIASFQSVASPDDAYSKSFKGWIAKIASRTAIDHLRKERKSFLTDELEKTSYQLAHAPASNHIGVKEIMTLLNRLPQMHRLVFNLYEVEGFSHEEIAQLLKIPASSSRVFLGRAKNKLRELYTAYNEILNK